MEDGTQKAPESGHSKHDMSEDVWDMPDETFRSRFWGLSQEDMWMLIRRFNYLVFRVKSIEHRPLPHMDMDLAEDEDNSPDKVQAHLTRLYMTIIIGFYRVAKHTARLRSWKEYRRTAVFLSVYVASWLANCLFLSFLTFVIILIAFPRSRVICFPSSPPAINKETGALQVPPAGVMGSDTSATAAPENHKGETIELEAHNFISSFGKVYLLSSILIPEFFHVSLPVP